MVSLPKKWVQANSPDAKSYVLLDVQEDCIIIEPIYIPEPEETVTESRDIRTKFDRKSMKLKEEAKDILNSIIAVEIVNYPRLKSWAS